MHFNQKINLKVCRAWSERDERSAVVVRAARSGLRHITFLLRSNCDCTTLFPSSLRWYYARTTLVLRSLFSTLSPRLFLTCSKCCHALHAHPDRQHHARARWRHDRTTIAPRSYCALHDLTTLDDHGTSVVQSWCDRALM
jgi:hypothetical protein